MNVRKPATSRLTSKGQTTIPLPIRRHLKIGPGDRVEYVVERNGRVVMLPATIDAAEVGGMLAPAPRRVSLAQMRAAIRKRGARR